MFILTYNDCMFTCCPKIWPKLVFQLHHGCKLPICLPELVIHTYQQIQPCLANDSSNAFFWMGVVVPWYFFSLKCVPVSLLDNKSASVLLHIGAEQTTSRKLHQGWHNSLMHVYHDVIKWKHFPRYWPFVRGIHRSPVNSPHKGQWRGAFMFSLICVWINGWVNSREARDFRRYRSHYDVTIMTRSHWVE